MTLSVSASDYLNSLRDQALLSVTVLAMVEETGKSWVSKVPYRLHTPDLAFTVDGKKGKNTQVLLLRTLTSKHIYAVLKDNVVKLAAGGSYLVKAFFKNPLKKSLTNIMFHIEGAKLTKALTLPRRYANSNNCFTVVPAGRSSVISYCRPGFGSGAVLK